MHYVRVNYDQVVGCDQAKQEMKKYVKHLRGASTLNKKICATVPTGVLITGELTSHASLSHIFTDFTDRSGRHWENSSCQRNGGRGVGAHHPTHGTPVLPAAAILAAAHCE